MSGEYFYSVRENVFTCDPEIVKWMDSDIPDYDGRIIVTTYVMRKDSRGNLRCGCPASIFHKGKCKHTILVEMFEKGIIDKVISLSDKNL